MQNLWVLVQSRVYEADRLLAGLETLLVDSRNQRREHGRGSGRSANESWGAFVEDDDVVADGGDVGVATSGGVVESLARVGAAVGLVWRLVLGKVRLDGLLLVRRLGVDVGETTAGAEAGDCGFLVLLGGAGEDGGADSVKVISTCFECGSDSWASYAVM